LVREFTHNWISCAKLLKKRFTFWQWVEKVDGYRFCKNIKPSTTTIYILRRFQEKWIKYRGVKQTTKAKNKKKGALSAPSSQYF